MRKVLIILFYRYLSGEMNMLLEFTLFIIGIATLISSTNFISKSTSNITHSFGIPEYLTSTVIISFIFSLPNFLLMFFSNTYDLPELGISTILGFTITTITLVMGIFLFRNEIPVEYEGYRNSTFMWAAALLFLILTLDKFLDRVDAIFLLLLFAFYSLYIFYRTEKSKEYVYLKIKPTNIALYPIGLFAVIISSFVVVGSVILLGSSFAVPTSFLGLLIFGPIFSLPMLDVIKNVFKSSKFTFDSIIGNVVVALTLIPGIAALILPIPFTNMIGTKLFPIIFLNIICLSFAIATRTTRDMHKKAGLALIISFVIYILFTYLLK